MKKIFLILTCLFVAPVFLSAQDTPSSLWELSQVVVSDQLGVEFDAPDGWSILRDVEHFAVYVAQNATDFGAISDGDISTLPVNPIISLNASLMDGQTQNMTLEEIANISTAVYDLEVVSAQEASVLARPALDVVIVGEDTNRAGMMALWRQSNIVFAFALTIVGTEIDEETLATWTLLLESIRPTGALELTETAEVPFLAYSINYPSGWSVRVEQRSGFNSLNISEFSGEDAEDSFRIVIWTTRTDSDADQTLTDVAERLARAFNVTHSDDIPIDDFMVLGQQGVGMGWSSREGETTYAILVPNTPVPELETYYIVTAPSQLRLNDFWTTWIAMLQSVQLLED